MSNVPPRKSTWRTAWQGQDIVVYCNEAEVDRVHGPAIERALLVHRGSGDSPGDLVRVLIESGESCLLFSIETGVAGRINFERQGFWAERGCVYWVGEARAPLPLRLRRGRWLFGLALPAFIRLPRAELAPFVARWPVQGPQTWDQRKWQRIERMRPFAPDEPVRRRA